VPYSSSRSAAFEVQLLRPIWPSYSWSSSCLTAGNWRRAKSVMRIARQRWRSDLEKRVSIAVMMPGAPSEIASRAQSRSQDQRVGLLIRSGSADPNVQTSRISLTKKLLHGVVPGFRRMYGAMAQGSKMHMLWASGRGKLNAMPSAPLAAGVARWYGSAAPVHFKSLGHERSRTSCPV